MLFCVNLFIHIHLSIQDSNDNFFLMNNLLNFDDDRKDCESFLDTIRDREWLDLIDFKEEPAFFEDFNHPVKDSERKIKHNKSKN